MSSLLWRASLRHLGRHPWQIALSILGIALGVSVVVAVDLAGRSAQRAFELATEAVTGRATHQIAGGSAGLPEDLYRRLRVELGLRQTAPVLEAWAVTVGGAERPLHLLGIDPFAEAPFRPFLSRSSAAGAGGSLRPFLTRPGTGLLARETASELGLAPGDRLGLRIGGGQREVELVGVLEPADELSRQAVADLLVVDLSTAQELTGDRGRLTRIDLLLPEGEPGAAAVARIRRLLPAGAAIERSGSRTESTAQLTRAFNLNLEALSLLALLCGAFLIYNTMTFSVVQRRTLVGILRALGATRRQLFGLVLGEALGIGIVGSLLGLAAGIVLGRGLVDLVSQTINDLYFVVRVKSLAVEGGPLVRGLFLGLGATLLATLRPAWEATTAPPRAVLSRSELEQRTRRAVPAVTLSGCALLAAGAVLLAGTRDSLAGSFAALFAVLVGCALLTPLATLALTRAFRPPLTRLSGMLGRMAARDVAANLSRTGVAIAALMMAVAVTVGVGLMISSFRSTVKGWLEFSLPADLYASLDSSPALRMSGSGDSIDPLRVERLAALPGVARVNTLRRLDLATPGGPTRLLALDLDFRSYGAFRFKSGEPDRLWPRFQRGEAVIVSEPYAHRRGIDVGAEIELPAPGGPRRLPVAGIFFDYSSDRGLVMIDRGAYARIWGDDAISAVAIFANPGTDLDQLASRVRREVGSTPGIVLRSARAVREESLRVFDRTFLITGVLRLLATLVAFIGVLSALMALQLERGRELGLLRATGLTRGQLWGLVTAQTGLMGLVAGLLSLPVGLLMAAMMVFVINRRSFGWTMPLELAPGILVQAVALAVAAALLAGLYPAFRMSRTSPAEALRQE